MRLYRVEHGLDGKGPYQYEYKCDPDDNDKRYDLVSNIGMAHNDCWRDVRVTHPGPHQDGLGYMDRDTLDWLFACTSIETLRQWFDGFGKDLRETGFHTIVLDVPDEHVKIGDTKRQAIYDPEYATVTGTRKIGWA